MRVVFAGTPAFGAASLKALLDGRVHQVVAVLTQPDRPAGRGLRVSFSPVKALALSRGLPVHQPDELKDPAVSELLRSYAPDVVVVSAYGHFFPKQILDLPPIGCINVHASLLPRHRGASPISSAVLEGDRFAGVSIIKMTSALDAGPVCLSLATPLDDHTDAQKLHDLLAVMGGQCICLALDRLLQGRLQWVDQNQEEASYAPKLKKRYTIDWCCSAKAISRFVRAFGSSSGVYSTCRGQLIRIWALEEADFDYDYAVLGKCCPGTVLSVQKRGVVVCCGQGSVRLLSLQKPGGKRLPAFDFSLGAALSFGSVFCETQT